MFLRLFRDGFQSENYCFWIKNRKIAEQNRHFCPDRLLEGQLTGVIRNVLPIYKGGKTNGYNNKAIVEIWHKTNLRKKNTKHFNDERFAICGYCAKIKYYLQKIRVVGLFETKKCLKTHKIIAQVILRC